MYIQSNIVPSAPQPQFHYIHIQMNIRSIKIKKQSPKRAARYKKTNNVRESHLQNTKCSLLKRTCSDLKFSYQSFSLIKKQTMKRYN